MRIKLFSTIFFIFLDPCGSALYPSVNDQCGSTVRQCQSTTSNRRQLILCSCLIWSRYLARSSLDIVSRVECCTSFFSTKNPNSWDFNLIALTAAVYCFLPQASTNTLSSLSTSFDTDSLVKRLASLRNLSIYWIILSFFKLRAACTWAEVSL